jgi:hypothetical protein
MVMNPSTTAEMVKSPALRLFRSPLASDVVQARRHGVGELLLVDYVASFRVNLEEKTLQLRETRREPEQHVTRNVTHMAFLRLSRRSSDLDVRSIDHIRKLVEGDSAFVVLVDGLDEHLTLTACDLQSHLVENKLKVCRHNIPRLFEGEVAEGREE